MAGRPTRNLDRCRLIGAGLLVLIASSAAAARQAPPEDAPPASPGTPSQSLDVRLVPEGGLPDQAASPAGSLTTAEPPKEDPAPGTAPAPQGEPPAPSGTEAGTAEAPPPAVPAAPETADGSMGSLLKTDKLKLDGYWWLHYRKVASFPMDPNGGRDGLNQSLDHRLRLRPRLMLAKSVDIVANLDLLAGQVYGDTSRAAAEALWVPRDRNAFSGRSALRELYLEWRSVAGVLRVGQMHSTWGLGIVANDGEDRPDNFQDTFHGDRVERVQFTFRPATWGTEAPWAQGLHVSVAGDLVFRDDNADLVAGDKAWQVIGAVFWKGPALARWDAFGGVYVAYRNQRYDDGDRLEATLVDVATRHDVEVGDSGVHLVAEAEGAALVGHTNSVRMERAPDGVDVASYALVGRLSTVVPKAHLTGSLEVGFASGDRDPRDDKARAFTMDPDYQAGMILFQEVLGRSSAWAASRISDPALVAVPPKGWERVPTQGGITNAVYLYPRVKWSPLKGLNLHLAFLWARAPTAVVDPYSANVQNGGYPRSYRNGAPSKDLGWEVDGGVTYDSPKFFGPFYVRLGLMGGWCRPGSAFDDAQGNSLPGIYAVRLMADLRF